MWNLNPKNILILAIIAALIMFPALDSFPYSSTNTSGIHTSDHGVTGIVKTNSDFHYKGISNGIAPTSQTKKNHKTNSGETPFVPVKNFMTSDTNLSVNPQQLYSSEPAPMGIADYGLSTSGLSGYNSYSYSTPSFLGKVNITSLNTDNKSSSSVGTEMSFQMNVNLEFYNSGTEYDYWIQNVAFVQTSSPQSIEFIDNVWNFSSQGAEMHNSTIAGNGTVSKSGNTGYYYAIANNTLPGNDVNFVYPEEFQLKVVSEINAQGNPEVLFEYNDGHGWITYDNPSFIFAGSVTSDPGFTVNGSSYNPFGTYYDAELIMGGPGGGSNTKDVSSNLSLKLQYWNGHNYQMISNAFNHGSDTAEGISNVISSPQYLTGTGSIYASDTPGNTSLGEIYNYTDVGILNLSTVLKSGILSVGGDMHDFVNCSLNLTLGPGNYSLILYNSTNPGLPVWKSTVKISAGSYTSMNANGFYRVTFSETGLPSGAGWFVNITGGSSSGKITSDVYTIYLKNGTYYYNVSTTLKTYMPSYSGTFKLAGGNANQSISFMEVKYTVVFQEAGLPDGTQWYINGTSNISASSTVGNITLSLTNGTYELEVSNLSSYYAFHNQYNVTVSGSNLTEKVLYYPYSHIYGMLNPQNAVIKINGREISTLNGRYSATVANGTYSVVVSSPGYSIFYRNLTIKAGTNISLNIILNRSTGSGSSTDKYGANDTYFIGSLVAVLAIAGIASVYSRRRH